MALRPSSTNLPRALVHFGLFCFLKTSVVFHNYYNNNLNPLLLRPSNNNINYTTKTTRLQQLLQPFKDSLKLFTSSPSDWNFVRFPMTELDYINYGVYDGGRGGITDFGIERREWIKDGCLAKFSGSALRLAGHSHWQNIKHQKARKDIQKAAEFSKIAKAIKTAVKMNPSPKENATLAQHIETAKKIGFPKEKIQNIIRSTMDNSSSGSESDANIYEGRGPGNTMVMVFVSTDNLHRSTQYVKHAFNKYGGSVGNPGSSSFAFKKVGVLVHKTNGKSENEMIDLLLENEVEEFSFNDTEQTEIRVETSPLNMMQIKSSLEQFGLPNVLYEVQYIPQQLVDLEEDEKEQLNNMIEALDKLDDVTEIVHNANFEEKD